jgi:hypothetical protein
VTPRRSEACLTGRLAHPWLRVERIVRQVLRTTWRGDRLADLLTAAPGLWEERRRIREAGWFN